MTTLKLHGHNGLDNIEIKHHLSSLENTILGLFLMQKKKCEYHNKVLKHINEYK